MTGALPLLLMMAAGSIAQPAQKFLMISERTLAHATSRPPTVLAPRRGIAPSRLARLSVPVMIPNIGLTRRGDARVEWLTLADPIRLETAPIDDPTRTFAAGLRPSRINPFRLFGEEALSTAVFPDRLPSASPTTSPPAPAPLPSPVLSAIDITPMLRIGLTPSGPRFVMLTVPEIGAPGASVRPSW